MNLMTVFLLQAPVTGPDASWTWIMLIAMFVIMYFFMIRPQNKKQKEIANRGNRKAPQNFGQAAARRAKLKASVRPRRVDLPERVERNPKWVAALAELDDMAKSYHEAQRAKARLRKKRQKAAKDKEGDTVMQDAPLETSESTKEAPIIGGMRRPLLEVMINRRWR